MRAENPHSEGESFQEIDRQERNLEDIVSTQLNVENINTYADDALRDLIEFTNRKVANYRMINSSVGLSDKEVEDMAFKYYGIENIGSLLDYVSDKAKEIHRLDVVIYNIEKDDQQVIIEPDKISPRTNINRSTSPKNNSEYQERRNIDRLKTVLFVLEENFGVDVLDSTQLTIQEGGLGDEMMRRNSYYFIQIPSIKRIILTCDEVGNITYVFNSEELRKRGINNQQIISSTKSELNRLIENDSNIGRTVIYRKNGFVPRLIDAIKKPNNTIPDELSSGMEDTARYFIPKLPEEYLSIKGLAKKTGMGVATIEKIISEIDPEQFGEVGKYAIRAYTTNGYSPEQIEMIVGQIEQKGYWNIPDNCLSVNAISKELGVSSQTINKIIGEIDPEQLGKVGMYMMGTHVVNGYSPEQIRIIRQNVEKKGYWKEIPAGYLSTKTMAKKLGTTPQTINKVLDKIDPVDLGMIGIYLIGTHVVNGYSPEQQEVIGDYIASHK